MDARQEVEESRRALMGADGTPEAVQLCGTERADKVKFHRQALGLPPLWRPSR